MLVPIREGLVDHDRTRTSVPVPRVEKPAANDGTCIVSKNPGDTTSVVASICSDGGNGGRSSSVNVPEFGVLLRNRVDVSR
jgi:hypothetical protein